MGRWSTPVAERFVGWLGMPPHGAWLDVGCGTGALTRVVQAKAFPSSVAAVDTSPGFVDTARRNLGAAAEVRIGDAASLPFPDRTFDAVISGLALNFVGDPVGVIDEMRRVTRESGRIGLYVWDYAERMEMLRRFWDAATSIDPRAAKLDEAVRFPLCTHDRLVDLFAAAGLHARKAVALEVPTTFADFDDYWTPFLGGQGPAPGYVAGLDEERRERLATELRSSLPTSDDESIALTARAWAVAGSR